MAKISLASILKADNWADLITEIYPGCDLNFWAARRAQALKETRTPKKSHKSTRRAGKPRAKFNYAVQDLSGAELQLTRRTTATAELVARANGPEPGRRSDG